MSNAQMKTRMATRYGLNTVLMMETISTWYMRTGFPSTGQAREASKILSPRGVWHEFILRDMGDFVREDKIYYLAIVTRINIMRSQSC